MAGEFDEQIFERRSLDPKTVQRGRACREGGKRGGHIAGLDHNRIVLEVVRFAEGHPRRPRRAIERHKRVPIVLFKQRSGCPLFDDATAVHDGEHVAQKLRLLHVVRGQHNGAPLGADLIDQSPQVAPRLRIEACGRFIQKQNLGVVDQRECEQAALALTAGELGDVAIQKGLELADGDKLLEWAGAWIHRGKRAQRVVHGQKIHQRRGLKLDPDAALKARVARCAPIQHLASRRLANAFDNLDGGRLAGPVGSEQPKANPFFDGERHIFHRYHIAEALMQVADLQKGWGSASTLAPR